MSRSSRGLGHRPFTAVTGVRIPYGTPLKSIDQSVAADQSRSAKHLTEYTVPQHQPMWRYRRAWRSSTGVGTADHAVADPFIASNTARSSACCVWIEPMSGPPYSSLWVSTQIWTHIEVMILRRSTVQPCRAPPVAAAISRFLRRADPAGCQWPRKVHHFGAAKLATAFDEARCLLKLGEHPRSLTNHIYEAQCGEPTGAWPQEYNYFLLDIGQKYSVALGEHAHQDAVCGLGGRHSVVVFPSMTMR